VTKYVTGFLFSLDGNDVALIEKQKPEWQKGMINGIGGKIKDGETPAQAMEREFAEETGVVIPAEKWDHYVTLYNDWFECHFFRAKSDKIKDVRTMEKETVVTLNIRVALVGAPLIPNLHWLIPLAQDVGLHIGEGNVLVIKDGKPSNAPP